MVTGLGFGRGETTAGMSNFRSLANIGSPLMYAAVYNWGAGRNLAKVCLQWCSELNLQSLLVPATLP